MSHFALILYGIFTHLHDFGPLMGDTLADTRDGVAGAGHGRPAHAVPARLLARRRHVHRDRGRLEQHRHPARAAVETGKKTMAYMASSLAFTAGGILLCYLLNDVTHKPGRTLNASLWSVLSQNWMLWGLPVGAAVVVFTLLSEGALLFVAAQTGFVAGPATLAAMAVDQWVPKRFAHLSERLVTQNGIVTMGLAAIATLLYSGGAVKLLIVMYSINVFLTFTLSQMGMVRHWWQVRRTEAHWRRRFVLASRRHRWSPPGSWW
jgi:hypothetical protein